MSSVASAMRPASIEWSFCPGPATGNCGVRPSAPAFESVSGTASSENCVVNETDDHGTVPNVSSSSNRLPPLVGRTKFTEYSAPGTNASISVEEK
jgi:hypothetical protein